MRILIAEDELISRKILAGLLNKFGHEIITAADGNQAWQLMQGPEAPKLAILDWNMPGLDGVEICRRIRTTADPNPPFIILLTARADEQSIVEGLDAGANDYLTKPYKTEELRARISVGERMLQLQSDLFEAKERLAHEAMHDSLTGVFNRRAILEALPRELTRADRQYSNLSIGLCDIDLFKSINDLFGHQVGDEVLKGVVQILRCNLRQYDLIGRYGGEEFLVIAPSSTENPAFALYERLCKSVSDSVIAARQQEVRVSISIGVAATGGQRRMDDLLAEADAALYKAKADGRNRVRYASRDLAENLIS